MDLDHDVDDQTLLRAELARSEAERARAEAICERLQRDRLQQQRVETQLRAELSSATAERREAQQTIRLALSEIVSMREIWTHTHNRLEDERRARSAERVQLVEARLRVELQRDAAHEQLTAVTSSRVWIATRSLRRGAALVRRVRAGHRRA